MLDISEKDFESTFEAALLATASAGAATLREPGADEPPPAAGFTPGRYLQRTTADYDKALCLLPADVIGFIYATQPKMWAKFEKLHGVNAKDRLLKRVSDEVGALGALDVLRKGVKSDGCKFALAYFRPASGLNPEAQRLYHGNLFAVARQVHYSAKNNNSLDMVVFLNGLPLFTAELKDPLTGQTVADAMRQYRGDRDAREPLFAFGRCLAHFAVDPELVYVTTHLQGPATRFLPFNQGHAGGAGNPPNWRDFATSYLWQETWAKDSVLELIQRFMQVVDEEDADGKKTGRKKQLFPRYHQLDAVRRLVRDAQDHGPGRRYLIQHSAGSGKSNSIAWLAHQLSILHDVADRRIFDSIIVITDRRVLDRQLQSTVKQHEQVTGVVENIDQTSRQLKQALADGKTIIVTTLQKFPVVLKDAADLPDRRFAVIIDEAHSSQSGETSAKMKLVLAPKTLEDAEQQEETTGDDLEDRIVEAAQKRGFLPNVSYFAFTATPKAKTMQLFGVQREDGSFAPFSLYSMRQAIEEGFILDVLQNYTTYQSYWSLLKTVADDPRYEKQKASFLLRNFVDLNPHAIDRKVAIMIEHFAGQVMGRIGGHAKAMIVTRSRLHAVRYKLEVDKYLKAHGYPFKALVAFSGKVKDPDTGLTYTETQMNSTPGERIPESATAQAFKRDEYRLLIVAEKFQTGFDQPLLHTMYMDKKLTGLNAVQTLSRLNRTHPGKDETMVLDFANEAEEIQKAFQPYYDRTVMPEGTDPNRLYDLETRLGRYEVFTQEEVDRFAGVYFDPKGTQAKLLAVLRPAQDRFKDITPEEQVEFRATLTDYVRLYAFLSQVLPFADAELEKLYVYGRLLVRALPGDRAKLPAEITQQIDIDSYRVQQTSSGPINLKPGRGELTPPGELPSHTLQPDPKEVLSAIIKELNERFGTDFSAEDWVFVQDLEDRLEANPTLEASIRANTRDNARLTFDHVVNDTLQDMIDVNFQFYKQVNDNPQFARHLLDRLFERYLKSRDPNQPAT